jgi:hypothetical protein
MSCRFGSAGFDWTGIWVPLDPLLQSRVCVWPCGSDFPFGYETEAETETEV